jgi:hypothetical protein
MAEPRPYKADCTHVWGAARSRTLIALPPYGGDGGIPSAVGGVTHLFRRDARGLCGLAQFLLLEPEHFECLTTPFARVACLLGRATTFAFVAPGFSGELVVRHDYSLGQAASFMA